MYQTAAKDLFQLQSELVDGKVDMAVSKTIERVVDQISDLRDEMNSRFSGIENRMGAIENRLVAVETKLGIVNEREKEIRNKIVEYAFRAGYALGGVVIAYLWFHIQALSH